MTNQPSADQLALRREVHDNRMKRWPNRSRSLLLRLALGRRTFDYMLRSIRNDKRTPAAKLVDIVVRQDGREVRTEADWVKTIAQMTYHLPPPSLLWPKRQPWWRRLWCAMDDHGGITTIDEESGLHMCKRCGAQVEI